MSQTNQNTMALQLEKVRDKFTLMYDRDDMLLTKIQQRGDVEMVSSRNLRGPLQVAPGGNAGAYNPDGGDLGRGSGTVYDFFQITPQYFRIAVEQNTLVKYATDTREKAIANAIKRELAQSMAQFRKFLDTILQTDGTGVIGTVAAGGVSGNTLTMAVPYGAALVYDNQIVQVYDTTLVTNRGSFKVVTSDPVTNQTIVADALPAGTVAGDVLVYDGLTGANPIGIYGLKYHQSNATTGTWLNLNRATYPVILATPAVNAANSALVPSFIRLALNKMRKALGINAENNKTRSPKLLGYGPLEQEQAWENLAITTSSIIKEGAGGRANDYDGLFTGKLTMSGIEFMPSIHADQTRIDFLNLSHWGRAVSKDIGLFEDGEGKTVFPVYGASGGVAAANIFYYDTGFNVFSDSPRSGAYVYALARPTGY